MKHLFSWTSLALLCAPLAFAQPAIRVDVPFGFTVGNRMLPAGEYKFTVDRDHMLSRIEPTNGLPVYLVRLVPGAVDRSAAKVDTGMLRFHKFGDRYALVGIWQAGEIAGNHVVASRQPRELAKTPVRDLASSQ